MTKTLIIAVLIGMVLTGCATFKENNPNQLKKSPCSCLELNEEIDNGIS